MKKNNELSVKSKLLFNGLDMNYKIVLDLNANDEKRIKNIDSIFSTYCLTLNPFIKDEKKEYQDRVYNSINNRKEELHRMVYEKATVEGYIFLLSPVLEHLKDMVSTCKVKIEKINELWNVVYD